MAAEDGINPLLRKGLWAISFVKKEQSRHPRKTFLEGTSGHPVGEPWFQVGLERGGALCPCGQPAWQRWPESTLLLSQQRQAD